MTRFASEAFDMGAGETTCLLDVIGTAVDSGAKGWSGRRDSNPRHQPWQGCTLPAELLPLNSGPSIFPSRVRPVKPERIRLSYSTGAVRSPAWQNGSCRTFFRER